MHVYIVGWYPQWMRGYVRNQALPKDVSSLSSRVFDLSNQSRALRLFVPALQMERQPRTRMVTSHLSPILKNHSRCPLLFANGHSLLQTFIPHIQAEPSPLRTVIILCSSRSRSCNVAVGRIAVLRRCCFGSPLRSAAQQLLRGLRIRRPCLLSSV
jgi:hypothetical protein